jgi:hypothetical protein
MSAITSSIGLSGKCSLCIALFRPRGSMQMRTLLLGFITVTIELKVFSKIDAKSSF